MDRRVGGSQAPRAEGTPDDAEKRVLSGASGSSGCPAGTGEAEGIRLSRSESEGCRSLSALPSGLAEPCAGAPWPLARRKHQAGSTLSNTRWIIPNTHKRHSGMQFRPDSRVQEHQEHQPDSSRYSQKLANNTGPKGIKEQENCRIAEKPNTTLSQTAVSRRSRLRVKQRKQRQYATLTLSPP